MISRKPTAAGSQATRMDMFYCSLSVSREGTGLNGLSVNLMDGQLIYPHSSLTHSTLRKPKVVERGEGSSLTLKMKSTALVLG